MSRQADDGRLGEIDRTVGVARGRRGRFIKVTRCDACGKPLTGRHFTDERACGSTDGPGFYICDRKRCIEQREKIEAQGGIEALRAYYTTTRQAAENQP